MIAVGESSASQPLIVQILLEKGILKAKSLEVLRTAQTQVQGQGRVPVEKTLIHSGLATDVQIAAAYAEHCKLPSWPEAPDAPDAPEADPKLARLVPEKVCRERLLVPVAQRDETLDIAFASPHEMLLIDELQLLTNLTIWPLIAPVSAIETQIQTLYFSRPSAQDFVSQDHDFSDPEDEDQSLPSEADEGIVDLGETPPPGPDGRIIRMVNQILEQALRLGASDIHLEQFEDSCAIRLRVDGVLRETSSPSRSMFVPIVSRFKILAKMDIAEKRVPQDGAIALRSGQKRVDLRVNTIPTVYGEKMVMRILDKGAIPIKLTGLGFDERQSRDLVESLQMPHGLMLVTGPTGSGKSTTLYACLNLLNDPGTNICTVEDPVEYKFRGMNQVQVKTQVGLTFASALRAFLRQDPDVIMVGEVRDQETAQICMRAALTGHFVLSTIHTNDSLSAVTRLEDMQIEPFLLASTLRVLEAQRLVRCLCLECREAYACDEATARPHGLEVGQSLYRHRGCDFCRGTGYKGRVGVFEVVRITPRMGELIQTRASLPELRTAAREQGMKLLGDSGLDKVREGVTSLEEVLTITMAGEE
jgi:type IV pilus assembly protein PilB